MGAVRGALVGGLGLVALEVIVQPAAAGRVGGVFTTISKLTGSFLSPAAPGIPDLTKPKAALAPASPQGDAAAGTIPLQPDLTATVPLGPLPIMSSPTNPAAAVAAP